MPNVVAEWQEMLMPDLPTGTITFLFTDIEASTRLLERIGDRYALVLAECQRVLREAVQARGGHEVSLQGDACFFVFSSARDALAAAVEAQQTLFGGSGDHGASVRVRVGLHTGEATPAGETGYVGIDVHRAARICAAGHGGQILLSQATRDLAEDDLPPGVHLRDLGEHRLKDLARPQHLFQVVAPGLPAEFPPLRSLGTLPNNLPGQLTSFVGREKEVAEVKRLLSQTRLLTLTGSGGAGKTRLALEVAAQLLEVFPEGVWMVDLASLSDPALVAHAVAQAVGVPEQPGRGMTDILVDGLRPKSLLLVLDNCEHVLPACAQLTATLLRSCPSLRVLATSRERLGVDGELTYRVPSLSLPEPRRPLPPEHLARYEAVRLFVERAAFVHPGFHITHRNAPALVQVCQRLDGIPLAIELAAARTKVLSLEQIASKLDDQFRLLTGGSRTALPRQQTLRATMDWSYQLLFDEEQALLRRLSVFAGGWSLEAAEAVCSQGGVEAIMGILDLLLQLVDKSLVVVDTQGPEARYRLLETVRQYGWERLSEAGEADELRRRHRDRYLELAERAAPELRGPHQDEWLERLETEHDNLRAALEWSRTAQDGAPALVRFAGALSWFWYVRGHWSEGREWTETALASGRGASDSAWARAMLAAGIFAWRQGDNVRAKALLTELQPLCRATGDDWSLAHSFITLGYAAVTDGDYERAIALGNEALVLWKRVGAKWGIAMSLSLLGHVATHRENFTQAAMFLTESLALRRAAGDTWGIASGLQRLGFVMERCGDYEQATALFKESLAHEKALGDTRVIAECLIGLAETAYAQGQLTRAVVLFGAAGALREILGASLPHFDRTGFDAHVEAIGAQVGDDAFKPALAKGRAMTLEQAIQYALEGGDEEA